MSFLKFPGFLRTLVGVIAVLLLASNAIANEQEEGGHNFPPVFELVNQDGVHVFLLGTAHVLPRGTPWISQEIVQSLEASELIVLEVDINGAFSPDIQAYVQEVGMYSDDRTLES